MKKIAIRVDGNSNIGLGHVSRMMALASMLDNEFKISFFVTDPKKIEPILGESPYELFDSTNFWSQISGFEIVVFDGYDFNKQIHQQAKNRGVKVVYIDDLGGDDFVADVVISHNLGAGNQKYLSKEETCFYLGSSYLLLRSDFFGRTTIAVNERIKSVFIAIGGADLHNYSELILKKVRSFFKDAKVKILISNVNPHQEKLMRVASSSSEQVELYCNKSSREIVEIISSVDFAITSASVSSYEVCAIGKPLIVGTWVDNQIEIARALAESEMALNISDFSNVESSLEKSFKEISSFEKRKQMVARQRALVDGKSPERIREIFRKL